MIHKPVLLKEVLSYWHPVPGGYYGDCTLGTGGHTLELLKSDAQLQCIGLDLDQDAISVSMNRLQPFLDRLFIFHANYTELPSLMEKLGWKKLSGVLLDLGVSSLQLENSERGFSFQKAGPLDMRMDQTQKRDAKSLISLLSERELSRLILKYGEEKQSKALAHILKTALKKNPDLDTITFAQLIGNRVGKRSNKINPATKTFQALRIGVNHELENLEKFLNHVPNLLEQGGRLLCITFHSLEDRCIKKRGNLWRNPCICPPDMPRCVCGLHPLFKNLTPKPIQPSPQEILENPRSRSAKLRVYERC